MGVADTGLAAVEMARDLKPDLILMDVVMPGELDGISAAQRIKGETAAARFLLFSPSQSPVFALKHLRNRNRHHGGRHPVTAHIQHVTAQMTTFIIKPEKIEDIPAHMFTRFEPPCDMKLFG